jgi:cysteine desulfurase
MKRIYLDYASTTPIDKRILKKMSEFSENFGNPSSISEEGVMAKKQLDECRKNVAECLSCHSDEIVFTSGGTESNNLAIFGVVNSLAKKSVAYEKMHIISSNIEHSSINEVLESLRKLGVKIDYLNVDNEGLVNPRDLRKLLKKETVLVSVMFANNEIGTIEPIKEIAKEIRHFKKFNGVGIEKEISFPYFHTDASQAFCYQEIKVESLGVDFLTLDSQKVYGPKGVGVLYVKRKSELEPVILGGGQENGLRSGTENVPMISAFALALKIAEQEREKENKRLLVLRDYLIKEIPNIFEGAVLNGSKNFRLSNNVNFSLPNCDTEMLVLRLDAKGVSISTKSACMGQGEGSYVVKALGGLNWKINNTIRVSVGRYTTKNDCENFISTLRKIKKDFF